MENASNVVHRLPPGASQPTTSTFTGPLNSSLATVDRSFHLLVSPQGAWTLSTVDWAHPLWANLPLTSAPGMFAADARSLYLAELRCNGVAPYAYYCANPMSVVLLVESLAEPDASFAMPRTELPLQVDAPHARGPAAVLGDTIYWGTDALLSVSTAGGTAKTLASIDGTLVELAAADGLLFGLVTKDGAFRIVSMPLDGAVTTVLVESAQTLSSLEVVDHRIYWVEGDASGGKARRMPAAGGAPSTLLDGAIVTDITVARGELYYLVAVPAPSVPSPAPIPASRYTSYLAVASLPAVGDL